MIQPQVRYNIRRDSWDVLYFGQAYPFTRWKDALERATVEDITFGLFLGYPVEWDDYEGLGVIG